MLDQRKQVTSKIQSWDLGSFNTMLIRLSQQPSKVVQDTVTQLSSVELSAQSTQSPYIDICEFWVILNLKNNLLVQKYDSLEEMWLVVNKSNLRGYVSTCFNHRFVAARDVTLKRSSYQECIDLHVLLLHTYEIMDGLRIWKNR